ncbi:UNVERIFIED_CONTAM: hypothetical protein PYX00_008541 [Menopon gallinae]|uniref:Major facilitator superfamily (MFS) profile domain-containing protein n=1 Tax=Menopon gallinae TaxID=328185 RepID=A0AAW2HPK9_9NEOP
MRSKINITTIFDDVPGVTGKNVDKCNAELASVDFEKAVSLTGFGKFQYLILIVSGLIFASAGFQNGLNAYVMPAAESDLSLSSSDKGLLNAVFLIGGLASAFFWGILADHIGRKKILVVSLLLDGILTLISTLSQTFTVFAIFRFLSGFIIGAPGSIVVPYLGEFFSNNHRASMLCAVGFFWTVSWIVLPAAALGIIPITWSYQVQGFTFNSWRMYVALFAVPTLVCGTLLAIYIPESPKYLFSQGKETETLAVLKYMYTITYGTSHGEYPVKTILSDEKEGPTTSSIIINTITSIREVLVRNHHFTRFVKKYGTKPFPFLAIQSFAQRFWRARLYLPICSVTTVSVYGCQISSIGSKNTTKYQTSR